MKKSCAILLLALVVLSRPALAQDTLLATAGVPRFKVGPVPPSPSFRYGIYVSGVKIVAEIKNMDAKKATETNAQASQRKAKLIVDEINKQITAAIADGKLPAGTPMATVGTAPATVPNVDKDGKPIPNQPATKPNPQNGFGIITVPGYTGFVDAKDKDGSFRDPSGEPNGIAVIRPGGASSGGARGALGGTGSGTGLAMGSDPDGSPSFVSFGLYEPRGLDTACGSDFPPSSPCPGDYLVTLFPSSGMNDGQVMGALSLLFNSAYAGSGFTTTYDPLTDMLTIDQPFTNYMTLFVQNTDLGLDLDPEMALVTPEPPAIVMLGTGLLALACLRRLNASARGSRSRSWLSPGS